MASAEDKAVLQALHARWISSRRHQDEEERKEKDEGQED